MLVFFFRKKYVPYVIPIIAFRTILRDRIFVTERRTRVDTAVDQLQSPITLFFVSCTQDDVTRHEPEAARIVTADRRNRNKRFTSNRNTLKTQHCLTDKDFTLFYDDRYVVPSIFPYKIAR